MTNDANETTKTIDTKTNDTTNVHEITNTEDNVVLDGDYYICECPHCNNGFIVHRNELNCRIFRHGIYKHNLQQMNPHESKEVCDTLIINNSIIGCGKPIKICQINKNKWKLEICDYI